MTETWKTIEGYPDYAISDMGQVKRLTSRTCAKAGSILKQAWSGGRKADKRYLIVDLCRLGEGKRTCSVHVLVAEAFLGARPEGMVPNHMDGDRSNNAASNLEWVTQSRNVKHAYELGLADAKGEANGQAKLTTEQVTSIRRESTGRWGEYTALARAYDVSPRQIADIIKGKAWPHVTALAA